MSYQLLRTDCFDWLKAAEPASIHAVVTDPPYGLVEFSDKERAALQWAESVTLIYETGAPDADYQLAAAQFNEKQLVDLTIAIGLINAYNRLEISFRRTPKAVFSA